MLGFVHYRTSNCQSILLLGTCLVLASGCFCYANGETKLDRSDVVHGTIDVVIATKHGFVFASDSRATKGTQFSDDAQKIFRIDGHCAATVAGVVGSEVGMDGFAVRDSIGTSFQLLNEHPPQNVDIREVSNAFVFGAAGVAGLEHPGMALSGENAAAMIAACWSEHGAGHWMTLVLPYEPRVASNGKTYYTVEDFSLPLQELPSSGFEVRAIGYPQIVRLLLAANKPISDSFSKDDAVKLYYRRKRDGHLNDYSLSEAVELAKVLVRATMDLSPTEAGVGGPIDLGLLTAEGFSWVSRKPKFAPFPPTHFIRSVVSTFKGVRQPLDGMEFVFCSFENVKLTFAGVSDTQLLGPELSGDCELALAPGAYQRMPGTVDRLKKVVRGKCKIVEESSADMSPVR